MENNEEQSFHAGDLPIIGLLLNADYTFFPGGMVPGVVIIQPDFPELKEAWPFLWYENEYVVDAVTSFILAANAADAETKNAQ
jgi:hypothetical protein